MSEQSSKRKRVEKPGPGSVPRKMEDLKPADYNPRTIDVEALKALRKSLADFGDISGLVWNARSGHLVCGHQRLRALREAHGDKLRLVVDAVVTPAGEKFPIRTVDWDDLTEKAANIAANSQLLAGSFTAGLDALVDEIEAGLPNLADELRLGEIVIDADDLVVPGAAGDPTAGPPEMELQPFEHYDYLIILATTTQDWYWLCDKLGIVRVQASPLGKRKQIGLGRAINARRLIDLIEGKGGKGKS